MKLLPTGSQTVGPFFSIGMSELCQKPPAEGSIPAGALTIFGKLLDGDKKPIPDALFEFWSGAEFVRVATNENGSFCAVLKKPADHRHFNVLIFMRGLLRPVLTRVYFVKADALNGDDTLEQVPEERRQTLFASSDNGTQFSWDIHMQGENETVFFDF